MCRILFFIFIFFIFFIPFSCNSYYGKPKSPPVSDFITVFDDPVEIQPHFPGGYQEFHHFVAKNIKWPIDEMTIQGRMIIDFVVEKDGRVSNVTVRRGLAHELDAEAVRVVKLSPKWIAGTSNGKPRSFFMEVPINFTLTSK